MLTREKTKRLLAILLAALMMVSMLAGCGEKGADSKSSASNETVQKDSAKTDSSKGNDSETSSGSSEKQEPVTLQFWTISLRPAFDDYFLNMFSKYESEHKNITIEWTDMPMDAIQSKFLTATAGGTAPDVVNLNTSLALIMAGKGALVDLEKEATEEQRSIYIKTLYESTRIKDSVYAFPWYNTPNVLIYNKALFEKAGLPNPPKTTDEMFEMAKIMKEKTGAYLYIPESLSGILFMDGIPMLNEDKTKAAFNNQETLNLLNQYKQAVDEGYIPKTGWGDWDVMLKQFNSGKLAMINSGPQSLKRIMDEAPDIYKNVEIAQTMVGKADIIPNPTMNLVVPAASKHHKEAIDFANFVTNDENQLEFCKQVAIFPSTIKASQDPFFKSDTTTLEGKALAIIADSLAKTSDLTLGHPKESTIFDEIKKVVEACIVGNEDPQKSLADAEKKVNEILAE